jgi:hypothetical protein
MMRVTNNSIPISSNNGFQEQYSTTQNKRKHNEVETDDEQEVKKLKEAQNYPIACASSFEDVKNVEIPTDCWKYILSYTNYQWIITKFSYVVSLRHHYIKSIDFWSMICNTQTIKINLDKGLISGIKFMTKNQLKNIEVYATKYIEYESQIEKIFKHIAVNVEKVYLDVSPANWIRVLEYINSLQYIKVNTLHGVNDKLAKCMIEGCEPTNLRSLGLKLYLPEGNCCLASTNLETLVYWVSNTDDLGWMNAYSCSNLIAVEIHDADNTFLKKLTCFSKRLQYLKLFIDLEITEPVVFTNLKTIDITGPSIILDQFLSVTHPNLTQLDYVYESYECYGKFRTSNIAPQPQLRSIHLKDLWNTRQVAKIIQLCEETLEDIDLENCRYIGPVNCRNLKRYYNDAMAITPDMIITNRLSLEELNIEYVDQLICLMSSIKELPVLRKLIVSRNLTLTRNQLYLILERCPVLSDLKCSINFGYKVLSYMLRDRMIHELYIHSFNFQGVGEKYSNNISIISSIKSFSTDQVLSLERVMDIFLSMPSLESASIQLSNQQVKSSDICELIEYTTADLSNKNKQDWIDVTNKMYQSRYKATASQHCVLKVLYQKPTTRF